jgi:CRISPR-associated protein Csy1
MSEAGLVSFIVGYIDNRKQLKLAALDKDAGKRMSDLPDDEQALVEVALAQERRAIESRFAVQQWLTDAAERAGQISLVTHALKFTHSDAKGSSIFSISETESEPHYLSTASLINPAIDAVGNAASLDVAKLLQTEYQGDSLIAALRRGDYSSLASLANDETQLAQWIDGFQQVLTDKQPSSHKLAKQLFFPLKDGSGYHIISPLYSSSLAQALLQRINATRFSEQAKEIREARKNQLWHDDPYIVYPNLAIQNIGGTKPQNVSLLNSVRGGKSLLLSCAPPNWLSRAKPPTQQQSIFHEGGEFDYLARQSLRQLRQFLVSIKNVENNEQIRTKRLAYLDEIIDILFNYAATIQNMVGNWSAEENKLKHSQQLWLDPYRSKVDASFKFEREGGDWKKEVAYDFGFWLNRRLDSEKLKFSEVERREWSTAKLFKQRLREFEQALAEDIK